MAIDQLGSDTPRMFTAARNNNCTAAEQKLIWGVFSTNSFTYR